MSDNTVEDEWHRANEDYKGGRFEESAERFRRIVRRDPAIWEAHSSLADVLKNLGEWDAAIAEYREAIRINPADIRTRAGLGEALSDKGEGEQAVIECLEALRRDPNCWHAHYALSAAFSRLGMWDAAIFECREALRFDLTAFEERAVRFAIGYAGFERTLGCRSRRNWLMLKRPGRIVRVRRGAAAKRGDWLAALEALKDYDTRYPGDPDSLTMLGRTQWALGERGVATDTLWKAFDADPSDPAPYYHLVRALLVLGRWKSLLRLFCQASASLNIDPHYRRMKRMERLIVRTPREE